MPKEKMFQVKLNRNYVPKGYDEVEDARCAQRGVPYEPKGYRVVQAVEAPHAGAISHGKLWAGTVVQLPLDEAASIINLKIAERDDPIPGFDAPDANAALDARQEELAALANKLEAKDEALEKLQADYKARMTALDERSRRLDEKLAALESAENVPEADDKKADDKKADDKKADDKKADDKKADDKKTEKK